MPEDDHLLPQAVLYLRVTRGTQEVQEKAIAAQRHACVRRANELGVTIVEEYTEHASGNVIDERPALGRLLDDLKNRDHVTFVIAYDHAGVAQNMQVYLQVLWAIEQAGAQLETASIDRAAGSNVSNDSALHTLMLAIGSRQHDATNVEAKRNANQPMTGGTEK
jgi:DNA invertase Pin-like site-specific DNA recombinase